MKARALQEYLEALAESMGAGPTERERKVLTSYAELQYKLRGGGKCGVCRAPVRHVMAVTIEREDGSSDDFPCLCNRCLEGEKGTARRIVLRIARKEMEFFKRGERAKSKAAAEAR